ncbi:hypothetical protein BXY70_2365 [Roseovarius halotolerans]|uniref:Lipoprotein n=1 Tax=Roseovarius halotolerans TaxID=505353 RepID=A0A1X6Z888_9RHOB|nr:hypothetical protein [Roseovarius halotolerans]RKT30376.1 hypothetical protein BXY70_2365 [Roseovarius halotolerans]SLN43594.1 hypothetical protein ROH8110_02262 [Roseovarius halotolerans]
MTDIFKVLLTLIAAAFLLTACADEDHYPVTGEECAPGDPVQDLDTSAVTCVPQAN